MTNNIKQERRYRRTEALILNGLTTLLQQKSTARQCFFEFCVQHDADTDMHSARFCTG